MRVKANLAYHAAALIGVALTACGSSAPDAARPVSSAPVAPALASAAPAPAARIAFEIPRNGAPADMLRTPWPTEMARTPDGRIDVRAYPGHDSSLISEYLTRASEDLDGFSVSQVIYFRFSGSLALASAPAQDTSRSPSAPIALVDVDPASPEKGTFYPLAFHATSRDMRYVKAGTLAVRPIDGFALRPRTLYAAVVRRSFGGAQGGLASPPDLDIVLAAAPRSDPIEERARALHAPAIAALEALGIARHDIASIALFRTGAPHAVVEKLLTVVDEMLARPPSPPAKATRGAALSPEQGSKLAPRIVSAEWDARLAVKGFYRVLRGTYCTPNFQDRVDNAPFVEREGGRVLWDRDGRPMTAVVPKSAPFASAECPGQLRARFVMSVPDAPMPQDGYPLLVTAHGTGGDAFSFLRQGDYAGWAALEGFAAISTDQPLNGGKESNRPGAAGPLVLPLGVPVPADQAGPPIAFYNPLYPGAARGNMHQAIADAAVLVRLFGGLDLGALRAPKGGPLLRAGRGEAAPRFDPRRTVLAGHSQGCQSLEVLGAIDPRARGVLLSGCGGDVRLGILYRKQFNFAPWVALTLGLDPEELSPSHPLLALVQNLADPIDPLAFARYYWDPLPGRAPQRVLHIEGLQDSYSPDVASEALAVALHAQPRFPLVKPIVGLALVQGPVSADRQVAQYAPSAGHDGHFVLYYEPGASDAFREFLRASPRR
jgi:hypothetical protein